MRQLCDRNRQALSMTAIHEIEKNNQCFVFWQFKKSRILLFSAAENRTEMVKVFLNLAVAWVS